MHRTIQQASSSRLLSGDEGLWIAAKSQRLRKVTEVAQWCFYNPHMQPTDREVAKKGRILY
ncbi:MAG TPA: hypothetical protein VGE97_07065 [Nitrososphaera sp.]